MIGHAALLWTIGLPFAVLGILRCFFLDEAIGWMVTFVSLFLFRYVRLIVNTYAYHTVKPYALAASPRFSPSDVSVVIPTRFANPEEHISCVRRILNCGPGQLIIVTAEAKYTEVLAHLIDAKLADSVILLTVERFDKKLQMTHALKVAVDGEICCFADDDVQWPCSQFLITMLACFEDFTIGACGPSQRVHRDPMEPCGVPTLWNFLGICYLERRNFNTGATVHAGRGGISTLSGRSALYQSCIIQNQEFYDYFLNSANHDDDKNLTRWTYMKGWNIALQFDPSAIIETTLEVDCIGFLGQCMRWARGHFRGNIRVMLTTHYWYTRHIWSLYAIYIAQWQTPALLWDGFTTYVLYENISSCQASTIITFLALWSFWIFLTKIVKIMGHFRRNPVDMLWIPCMVMFSYFHGVLNIWALLTLDNKGWGRKKM